MRTYTIIDVGRTEHLPSYDVIVEEISGELVCFQVRAQDAAHARARVDRDAHQYGVHITQIRSVKSTGT